MGMKACQGVELPRHFESHSSHCRCGGEEFCFCRRPHADDFWSTWLAEQWLTHGADDNIHQDCRRCTGGGRLSEHYTRLVASLDYQQHLRPFTFAVQVSNGYRKRAPTDFPDFPLTQR